MLKNAEHDAHDIAIVGGIWDYDNKNQAPNPIRSGEYRKYSASHRDGNPDTIVKYVDAYRGSVMRFYKITRLSIHDCMDDMRMKTVVENGMAMAKNLNSLCAVFSQKGVAEVKDAAPNTNLISPKTVIPTVKYEIKSGINEFVTEIVEIHFSADFEESLPNDYMPFEHINE